MFSFLNYLLYLSGPGPLNFNKRSSEKIHKIHNNKKKLSQAKILYLIYSVVDPFPSDPDPCLMCIKQKRDFIYKKYDILVILVDFHVFPRILPPGSVS